MFSMSALSFLNLSDRMTGQSGVVPIWIASPDTDNVDTINYVKMTKPLEKDTSKNL